MGCGKERGINVDDEIKYERRKEKGVIRDSNEQ
jgi:hypothetical protein